jgi:hypothetical protein
MSSKTAATSNTSEAWYDWLKSNINIRARDDGRLGRKQPCELRSCGSRIHELECSDVVLTLTPFPGRLQATMSGPSRFSSLNSFFRSKTPNPPPPPPKDRDRDNQSLYAQSSFSLSTRSFTIPRSTSPAPTTQTANSSVYHLNGNAGASSSVLNLNQFGGGSGSRQAGQSSAPSSFKRGVSRIASGLKRPKSRANLLQQEPATPKSEGDDGSISTPWNFQVRALSIASLHCFLMIYFILRSTIFTSTRASTGCRPRGLRRFYRRDIPTRRSPRCTMRDGRGPRRPLRLCALRRLLLPRAPSSHVLAHHLSVASGQIRLIAVLDSLYRRCRV